MAAAKKGSKVEVPAGYKVRVMAELPPAWDYQKSPVLEGTVQCVQRVTLTDDRGKRVTRVAHVANKEGVFGLWESATLAPLFDSLEEGNDVFVRFEGLGEAKPGRNAPKLFTGAIKG